MHKSVPQMKHRSGRFALFAEAIRAELFFRKTKQSENGAGFKAQRADNAAQARNAEFVWICQKFAHQRGTDANCGTKLPLGHIKADALELDLCLEILLGRLDGQFRGHSGSGHISTSHK